MKFIKPDNYHTLNLHIPYIVETLGAVKGRIGEVTKERAMIVSLSSKLREVKKDGQPTGETETVGDVVHYTPLNAKPGHISSTIGCGLFAIYSEDT